MAPPKKRKAQPVGVASVQKSQAPLIIAIIAIIAVVAIIAIVVALSQNKDSDSASGTVAEWQPVSVTGAALAAAPASGTDPAIGTAAPELRGEAFDGTPVNIINDGRAKAVMFFAHWCPHCRREAPLLATYIEQNKNKYSVDFYSVATGTQATQANFPPSTWFKDMSFPTPVLADDHSAPAAQAYGLSSYPYMVFIDKTGKVVSRTSGEIGTDVFDEYVKAAAGEGATPTTSAEDSSSATPVG